MESALTVKSNSFCALNIEIKQQFNPYKQLSKKTVTTDDCILGFHVSSDLQPFGLVWERNIGAVDTRTQPWRHKVHSPPNSNFPKIKFVYVNQCQPYLFENVAKQDMS